MNQFPEYSTEELVREIARRQTAVDAEPRPKDDVDWSSVRQAAARMIRTRSERGWTPGVDEKSEMLAKVMVALYGPEIREFFNWR